MNKRSANIEIGKFLKTINILFLFATWGVFYICGKNEYINLTTILLNSLLIIEVISILQYAEKRKNALLIVLCLLLTFFYVLRVITLTYVPYSAVFNRYEYSYSDVNHSLLFIICSTLFLFIGIFYCNRKKVDTTDENTGEVIISPSKILLLLLLSMTLLFFNFFEGTLLSRIYGYLTTFFVNIHLIIMSCIVYMIYYKDQMGKRQKQLFYVLFVLFILEVTLSGSRSALLTIASLVAFAFLSIYGTIWLKKKHIVYISLGIPVAMLFFITATFLRQNSASELQVEDKLNVLSTIEVSDNPKIILAPIFDRIGFLDYATELITQKKTYSSIMNMSYYTQSIIDNVLTPGFNIFDVPKVANSLIFVYDKRGTPSISTVEEYYQSDQLTMFGELYSLFGGWFSIILFFLVGYFFQNIMNKNNKMDIMPYIKNALLLHLFYVFANSFGLDWLLLDVVSACVTYLIIKWLRKRVVIRLDGNVIKW